MSERSRLLLRVALVYLAVTGLLVGVWAGLAPRSFYADFPGLGRVWVAVDGPYNEHLVRDVGWLNLALAVATVWAAVTLTRALVVAVALAWLVTSLPHLGYHLAHLDGLAPGDRIGELVSLALVPAVALGVLVVGARAAPRAGAGPG